MNHQHFNVVLTIQIASQQEQENDYEPLPPINLSNLKMNMIDGFGEMSGISFN